MEVYMKQLNLFAVLILTITLVGCNLIEPEVNIDVQAGMEDTLYGPVLKVIVVSKMDELKIDDIKLNRGNCGLAPVNVDHIKRKVINLKFGDEYEIYSYKCNINQLQELTLATGGVEYSWPLE